MKASELRIGNIVQDLIGLEIELYVYQIEIGVISCGFKDFSHPYLIETLKPIPLTEEWMLKLGLGERLHMFEPLLSGPGYRYKNLPFSPGLKYVHQIQNFIFAIEGKELELK